jgi:hypothetical protein
MREDPSYDDKIKDLVDWLRAKGGMTPQWILTHEAKDLKQLSDKSTLRSALDDALKTAAGPILRPRSGPVLPVVRMAPAPVAVAVSSTSAVSVAVARDVKDPVRSPAPIVPEHSAAVLKHAEKWKLVRITDIPAGPPGEYKIDPQDAMTVQVLRAAASGRVLKDLAADKSVTKATVVKTPEFWIQVGRLLSVQKEPMGRCFSCAGLAAYTLVMDPYFDGFEICVMGAPRYDHHFLCFGPPGTIKAKTGYAIDIWQGNLDKTFKYLEPMSTFKYLSLGSEVFATLAPKDRTKHREYAKTPDKD